MEQKQEVGENQSLKCQKFTCSETGNERAVKLVNYLATLYPAMANRISRDQSQFELTVKIWGDAISDLSDDQLRVGCRWCKDGGSHFEPSLPRFRHKCFGLIDSDIAFELAKSDPTRDRNIYAARLKIPSYEWKSTTDDKLRNKFLRAYGEICEMVVNGVIFDDPQSIKRVEKNTVIAINPSSKDYGSKSAKTISQLAEDLMNKKLKEKKHENN